MARISESEFARLPKRGVEEKPKPKVKDDPYRSKLERAYANYLDALMRVGEVLRWDYEPESFSLARATDKSLRGVRVKPDFRVIYVKDPTEIQFHEIKPEKRMRTERDSIVRLQWAAQLNPCYRWFLVRGRSDGGWSSTELERFS